MNADQDNKRFSGLLRRKWIFALIAVVVMLVVARQLIPSGLGGLRSIIPFLFFSLDRGRFESPDGEVTLVVYTNDAGAMSGAPYATWVIRRHWYGDEVVAKGDMLTSWDPVPLTWTGPRTFRIEFVDCRDHNCKPVIQTITLR